MKELQKCFWPARSFCESAPTRPRTWISFFVRWVPAYSWFSPDAFSPSPHIAFTSWAWFPRRGARRFSWPRRCWRRCVLGVNRKFSSRLVPTKKWFSWLVPWWHRFLRALFRTFKQDLCQSAQSFFFFVQFYDALSPAAGGIASSGRPKWGGAFRSFAI